MNGWVTTNDFDGDGKLDLAIVDYASSTVLVAIGSGDGSFQSPVTIAIGQPNPLAYIASVDLDHDGAADLVIGNSFRHEIMALLGTGDGTFRAPIYSATSETPRSFTAGDLDGDGVPDLAVTLLDVSGIGVMLGSGDGTFHSEVVYPLSAAPASVAIGDLNRDSWPDLVTANPDGNGIGVLLGQGAGTFRAAVDYPTEIFPTSVAIADFDGDSALDLVVGNNNGGADDVSVLLGRGDGTFAPALEYPVRFMSSTVLVGDFDGDHKLDVATVNGLLLGNGDGTFQARESGYLGTSPSMAAGDFDGDGRLDLATGAGSVLLGVGRRTLRSGSVYGLGTGSQDFQSLVAADLDGDGHLDLACIGEDSTIIVLRGAGDGSFGAALAHPSGGPSMGLTSADFDGDGHLDLVTYQQPSDSTGPKVTMLSGIGGGGFRAPQSHSVSFGFMRGAPGAPFMVAADVDRDGRLDIAISMTDSSGNDVIGLLKGNGDGTFRDETDLTVDAAGVIVADDFDRDGSVDLVVAGGWGLQVLLNDGRGGLRDTFDSTLATDGRIGMTSGDMNGDGILDLILTIQTADLLGETVRVLLGNGDGTFQSGLQSPVFPQAFSAALLAMDFNGDGKLDLVAAGTSVLLGNGDGTVQSALSYDVNGASLAIGDFNHDGRRDLAAADPGRVSVLLNGCPP